MNIKDILYNWGTFNNDIFFFFNNLFVDNTLFSLIMLLISLAFNFFVLLTWLSILLLICLFYNRSVFFSTKQHISFSPSLNAIILALFTSIVAATIGYSIKHLYALEYPRPLCVLENVNIIPYFGQTILEVIEKRCNQLDGSFPSMHSTFATIIVFSLWNVLENKFTKLLMITLIILVGISRISLGVHFPTDIVGGFIFGYLITSICRIIQSNFIEFINNKRFKY